MKKKRITAFIANAAPIAGGEWEKIAPYGDHPTADRKRIQKFYRAEAAAMVAEFNSVFSRMGKLFRGVPIFHGHPDVDPKNWPDDRRLGKIVALEDREDGLYGKPEFNALGQQNKDEGWWLYPSPAWLFPKSADKVIKPDELLSVGLVNTPNIDGSEPWANSADLDWEGEDESPNDEIEIIMKEKLCALLGIDPATATDEQLLEGVTLLKTQAGEKVAAEEVANTAKTEKETAEAAKAEEQKKKDDALAAAANSRRAAATVLANSAVTLGKITEAERQTTINSLAADGADIVTLGKDLLEKKSPALNTGHLNLGGKKVVISDAKARQTAVQTEVNSRMSARNLSYDQAYRSVKSDPDFAPLFDLMKKPGDSAE